MNEPYGDKHGVQYDSGIGIIVNQLQNLGLKVGNTY